MASMPVMQAIVSMDLSDFLPNRIYSRRTCTNQNSCMAVTKKKTLSFLGASQAPSDKLNP